MAVQARSAVRGWRRPQSTCSASSDSRAQVACFPPLRPSGDSKRPRPHDLGPARGLCCGEGGSLFHRSRHRRPGTEYFGANADALLHRCTQSGK